ncbi:MAG: ASPIC/UnbV domain-containing protein [Pirellulaceae bacterium]
MTSSFRTLVKLEGFDLVGVSHGAATADLDGDGDLDVVVNNMDTSASIYRNNLNDANYLRIKLVGAKSNRFGLGTTVRIEHDGQTQIRYVTLARGWNSTSELVATFGLGDAKQVDRMVIDWPSKFGKNCKTSRCDKS